MAPSPYIFIISICPVDMNKYARFDEIPSITLKDIKESKHYGRTDGRTSSRDGIYVATFSYFGYLCGYLPMCGLDTQESILATKVSNLRNKSHLYSKMTTCVSNCPNFIATGVPICLCGRTDGRTDNVKTVYPPINTVCGGYN